MWKPDGRYWFGVAVPFRFAICNELFKERSFARTCGQLHDLGYTGLEIAPFTLRQNAAELTPGDRKNLGSAMREAGLHFVGLHWLLVGPAGLHATTADENTRTRTWNYIRSLIDLSADLAAETADKETVMVFGSPKQRSTVDGMPPDEAVSLFIQELAEVAPQAEERGVKILVEPLSPDQTDVVTTLSEAVSIVKKIGSPAVQTMFDVHNAVREREPHTRLIHTFAGYIRHVHVNEFDGREPGTGDYDFGGLLSTLSAIDYAGWVSLEAFDFSRDPVEVAGRSIRHLKSSLPAAYAQSL